MIEQPSPANPAQLAGGGMTLALGNARVAVRSERPGVLEWLEEALAPSFRAVPERDGDVIVEVRDEVPTSAVRATDLVPCFALETGLVRMAGHVEPDSILVEDPEWGIRIALRRGRVSVWELTRHGVLRGTVLRAVRELALLQTLAAGSRQLHASAVAVRGQGVAFLGPKEAGKTTTAARIVAGGRASLVANDRVLLESGADRNTITGVPTLAGLRPGTVELLPEHFRTLPEVERPSRLTLAEYLAAGRAHGYVRVPRHVHLTVPELAHELGASLSPCAELACLAVIAVGDTADGFRVESISEEAASDAVGRFSFGWPRDATERTAFHWALGDGAPLEAPIDPSRPTLDLAGIRTVRLAVGPRFLDSAAAPERLMRTLLPSG